MPQCTKFVLVAILFDWLIFVSFFFNVKEKMDKSKSRWRSLGIFIGTIHLRGYDEKSRNVFLECSARSRRPRVVQQRNTQQERYATTFNASIVFFSSSDIPTVSHLKIIFRRTRITRVPECGTTEMWTHNPSAGGRC